MKTAVASTAKTPETIRRVSMRIRGAARVPTKAVAVTARRKPAGLTSTPKRRGAGQNEKQPDRSDESHLLSGTEYSSNGDGQSETAEDGRKDKREKSRPHLRDVAKGVVPGDCAKSDCEGGNKNTRHNILLDGDRAACKVGHRSVSWLDGGWAATCGPSYSLVPKPYWPTLMPRRLISSPNTLPSFWMAVFASAGGTCNDRCAQLRQAFRNLGLL